MSLTALFPLPALTSLIVVFAITLVISWCHHHNSSALTTAVLQGGHFLSPSRVENWLQYNVVHRLGRKRRHKGRKMPIRQKEEVILLLGEEKVKRNEIGLGPQGLSDLQCCVRVICCLRHSLICLNSQLDMQLRHVFPAV